MVKERNTQDSVNYRYFFDKWSLELTKQMSLDSPRFEKWREAQIMHLLCSVVREQAAGLFSFKEYQVLTLVPVNPGFLLLQPQASEPHSEICNVFWMHLSQPYGTKAQFVTAHYCSRRESIQKTRLWELRLIQWHCLDFWRAVVWLDDTVFFLRFYF